MVAMVASAATSLRKRPQQGRQPRPRRWNAAPSRTTHGRNMLSSPSPLPARRRPPRRRRARRGPRRPLLLLLRRSSSSAVVLAVRGPRPFSRRRRVATAAWGGRPTPRWRPLAAALALAARLASPSLSSLCRRHRLLRRCCCCLAPATALLGLQGDLLLILVIIGSRSL